MKVKNTCYQNKESLKSFIEEHQFDDSNLLIQIFTGVCEPKFITQLVSDIQSLLGQAVIIGATTAGEIINGKHQAETTVLSKTCQKTPSVLIFKQGEMNCRVMVV